MASKNNKSKSEAEIKQERELRLMNSVDDWASYYRANINRFASDYLGLHLKRFQQIMLCMFARFVNSIFLAYRGGSKSYIIAIYSVCRAILFPGSKIAIASKTRKQAAGILDKILVELYPNSPNLQNEIKDIKNSQYEMHIQFKNGSRIFIVTANEVSGRGHRANLLIVEEARLVSKQVIDDILKKYLTAPRHPGFLDKPEYFGYKVERNQAAYVTSCGYEGEWLYDMVNDFVDNMSPDGTHFCCSIGYQLGIKENLLQREFVEDEFLETNFDSVKHTIEMESLFWLQGESGLYNINDINRTRQIPYAWYPSTSNIKLTDKRIQIPPKQPNEIRLLMCDIALMASGKGKNNDATSIHIGQLLEGANKRFVHNIIYSENCEGLRTDTQALVIRRLFHEFDCDKLVIDGRGLGLGVVDLLMSDLIDPQTGNVYGALSCYNNPEFATRCHVKNAPKVIYVVHGTLDFNSRCATQLRESFRQGNIRLLTHEFDAEENLLSIGKKYSDLDPSDKVNMRTPYLNTSLLVNELIKLEMTILNGMVRLKERGNMRKDRYMALAYGNYVCREIEQELRQKQKNTQTTGLAQIFRFRAPKT